MKKALIVQGGWQGHEPGPVSEILAKALRENGFEVTISDTLDSFKDGEALKKLDLIVPIWTMGSIQREQLQPLLEAVKSDERIMPFQLQLKTNRLNRVFKDW